MLKRAKFIKRKNEYDGVFTFFFENNNINYKAGQYASVMAIGEERETRVLSFASHPSEDAVKFIMNTASNSAFKKTMMNLIEGQVVFLYDIKGKLKFPIQDEKNYVFLSGGVGIAPYRSLIKENIDESLNVIVAQVQEEKHLFKDELLPLVKSYIAIHPDNFDSDILNLIKNNKDAIFYVCGSKRFIEGVGKLFVETDFPESRIQLESFTREKDGTGCYVCTCGLRAQCNC